jgi:hypothetical protein
VVVVVLVPGGGTIGAGAGAVVVVCCVVVVVVGGVSSPQAARANTEAARTAAGKSFIPVKDIVSLLMVGCRVRLVDKTILQRRRFVRFYENDLMRSLRQQRGRMVNKRR